MTTENLPSPELLRKLLRYEPATGKLFWRERTPDLFTGAKTSVGSECKRWNSRHAGREAFTAQDSNGYRQGAIYNRAFYAHRVAWALVQGEWPTDQIDHINGDPSDNRIINLRAASNAENGKNQKRRSDNTSGATGVYRRKRSGKWEARIHLNGTEIHLGNFTDFDEAVAARKAAEVEHGYHPNHGRG